MADSIRLVYQGPPELLGALAQMLEAERLEVRYQPPMEDRHAAAVAQDVVVDLTVVGVGTATSAGTNAVVAQFEARWPHARLRREGVEISEESALVAALARLREAQRRVASATWSEIPPGGAPHELTAAENLADRALHDAWDAYVEVREAD